MHIHICMYVCIYIYIHTCMCSIDPGILDGPEATVRQSTFST